ncbi:MAG: glycoside hydrolase family 16 protein [Mycobacteriaceae bacterium]|nr:glycoside hydrolase family 16 protein [Mycobacteriaceae bacterium]
MTTLRSPHRPARRFANFTRLVAVVLAVLSGGWGTVQGAALARASAMFDDFNGPAGSRPDPAIWSYDVGAGGWGNDELQTYTDNPANARLDGDGHLILSTIRQADGGYTSARLTTRGKFSFATGRAEARIKVPDGDGLHPGFWLLGADIDRVGWPRSGEIDVMETIDDAGTYNCALHGPDVKGGAWQASGSDVWPAPLSHDFHTYWVQRSPGSIAIGVDQTQVCTFTAQNVGAQHVWEFDKPFNLLLNVSVGGNYAGPPSSQTPSVATMLVDWVRVIPT